MNLFFIVMSTLFFGLSTACNQAGFNSQSKKKGSESPLTDPSGQNGPKESDANPNDPANQNSNAVDCTGKSAAKCKEMKNEKDTKDSFRVIDCQDKEVEQCEEAVDEERQKDGDNESKIYVKNCKEDDKKSCEKLSEELNTSDTNITDNKIPVAEGNSGSDSDGGQIDEGEGSDTDKGTITEGDGESFKNKDIKWCAGGPVNAAFPFKSESEARSCASQIRLGGYNNSKECKTMARFGRCSYDGPLKEAVAKSPKIYQCNCLDLQISRVDGLSWDGSPQSP